MCYIYACVLKNHLYKEIPFQIKSNKINLILLYFFKWTKYKMYILPS